MIICVFQGVCFWNIENKSCPNELILWEVSQNPKQTKQILKDLAVYLMWNLKVCQAGSPTPWARWCDLFVLIGPKFGDLELEIRENMMWWAAQIHQYEFSLQFLYFCMYISAVDSGVLDLKSYLGHCMYNFDLRISFIECSFRKANLKKNSKPIVAYTSFYYQLT